MHLLNRFSMRSIAILLCVLTSSQVSIAAEQPAAGPGKQTPQTTPDANATNTPEQQAQARMMAAHTVYIADDGADQYFPVNASYGRDRLAARIQAWGH